MARKNKFKKGVNILTMDHFCEFVRGNGFIYWNQKIMHFGFICSMPYSTVIQSINRGILWEAVRND